MNTILLELIHDDNHSVLINLLQIEIVTVGKIDDARVIRLLFGSGRKMEVRDSSVSKKNYYTNITRLYNTKLIP